MSGLAWPRLTRRTGLTAGHGRWAPSARRPRPPPPPLLGAV